MRAPFLRASASTLTIAFVVLSGACGIELSGGSIAPPATTGDAGDAVDAGRPDASPTVDAGKDAEPPPFPTIVQLAAAIDRACVVEARGSLKCWGRNDNGQLGQGDTAARGDNAGEMGSKLLPVDLGPSALVTQVALGDRHSCAVLGDRSLKCWGYNGTGELGLGDLDTRGDGPGEMGAALEAVKLPAARTAKEVAVGYEHTCAILDDDTVRCWGLNSRGQLGAGDVRSRGGIDADLGDGLKVVDLGTNRTAKHLAAGGEHTCAILDNEEVKCWGSSSSGQLGYGDVNARGDGGGEMGQALNPVDLGPGRKARAIGAGTQHTCALLDDATVKCWGNASFGQCGTGDINSRGDGAGEMGAALKAIDLGQGHKAKGLGVGINHTCVVLDNEELRCFGAGSDGQLGPLPGGATSWGSTNNQMGSSLLSIDLGPGAKVRAVSAAETQTCALLGNEVKCFGKNAYGSLGQGDAKNRGKLPADMGAALLPISIY